MARDRRDNFGPDVGEKVRNANFRLVLLKK